MTEIIEKAQQCHLYYKLTQADRQTDRRTHKHNFRMAAPTTINRQFVKYLKFEVSTVGIYQLLSFIRFVSFCTPSNTWSSTSCSEIPSLSCSLKTIWEAIDLFKTEDLTNSKGTRNITQRRKWILDVLSRM